MHQPGFFRFPYQHRCLGFDCKSHKHLAEHTNVSRDARTNLTTQKQNARITERRAAPLAAAPSAAAAAAVVVVVVVLEAVIAVASLSPWCNPDESVWPSLLLLGIALITQSTVSGVKAKISPNVRFIKCASERLVFFCHVKTFAIFKTLRDDSVLQCKRAIPVELSRDSNAALWCEALGERSSG